MKTIETKITIHAPAYRVWEVLMDHAAFPEWNPFIRQINGRTEVGQQMEVIIDNGKQTMKFKPAVLVNKHEEEFRWLGHMIVKGLFDGEHFFQLRKLDDHTTELTHGEHFHGVLAGTLMKMIGEETKEGFIKMNEALKLRLETLKRVKYG